MNLQINSVKAFFVPRVINTYCLSPVAFKPSAVCPVQILQSSFLITRLCKFINNVFITSFPRVVSLAERKMGIN